MSTVQPAVAGPERAPRTYIILSIVAAVVTISLKMAAYLFTDSVGLLSDAMESVVNLVAAVVAFWALTVAALPPDEEHAYGHTKAEYFSSGVEAGLIMLAAAGIAWAAWGRLWKPQPLEQVWIGISISVLASIINGGVAVVLLRAGRRLDSISLRADAHHLMTDVWTSAGVILAILLVKVTGWLILDPLIAILVAANIVHIGVRLLNDTLHGLLDTALPQADQQTVSRVLDEYRARGIAFHAVRSRISGQRRFLSIHVLVPGAWTVQQGHDLCEDIENHLMTTLPRTTIFTHLEPLEDPLAFNDQTLDRGAA